MATSDNKSTRTRQSKGFRANKAAEILDNEVFREAQERAEREVITAMVNLRTDTLPYQEAAGIALSLVNKLQATRSQNRVLNRLIKAARMDPESDG